MMASDHIVTLAHGDELDTLESPTDSQEMIQLFEALEGLRIILGERAQHTERLKVLSETDGLTGLVNRRLFDRIGQGEAEFDQLPRDVNLIMMDLDRFKRINDTYGHLVGDLVLKHAAEIVTRVCRKSDLAARYGGEEIAVVVLDSDASAATQVAERIRSELEATPVQLSDGRRLHVTASFGVASGRRGAGNWLRLVKAADGALYEAKSAGRNCVVRSGGDAPEPDRRVA
jgi:diguanylate cyclase (GGDEF)-like protein